MTTNNDIHQQFAAFFPGGTLQPVAYLLSRHLSGGHICIDLEEWDAQPPNLPAPYHWPENLVERLRSEAMVSADGQNKQPFVLHKNRLYLQRYFHYETMILNRIKNFVLDEKALERNRTAALMQQKDFINSLFPKGSKNADGLDTIDWQHAAAISAVLNNFTIITGGPGTGKTTTVAKILSVLYKLDPQMKVGLAAPTGKAAARMAESLKAAASQIDPLIAASLTAQEPSTIHRLLKAQANSPHFKHHQNNPLDYDVVIIDESSMIGVALFAKLLDAIAPKTRLIMLGDKDQLASVEAGSLFGDLCQSQQALNIFSKERTALINNLNGILPATYQSTIDDLSIHPLFEHIVELKTSHRFKLDGGIGRFSKSIINNSVPDLQEMLLPNADPEVCVDTEFNNSVFEKFISGYEAFITEKDIKLALKKLNKLRVLCAIREGAQGLYATNRKIEKYLSDKGLITLKGEFYNNRPIIITSNNYALGLFNGDVGIIRPDHKGGLKAWFENSAGELRQIFPGLISNVETVFAMTIHKSQGSEFDQVLMVLPASGNIAMMTRELLYTGVTRAKSKIFVQATTDVIFSTAAARVQRASGIAQRFLQD